MDKSKIVVPKKSECTQKWIPEVYETEVINGVFFTNELRKELSPRVNGIKIPIRPIPTLEEAWSALYNGLWAADNTYVASNNRSKIWNYVISFNLNDRKLGERLLNHDIKDIKAISIEDDIFFSKAILYSYGLSTYYNEVQIYEGLTDYLVISYGLEKSIEILLTALDELPYTGVASFSRLRELLSLESEENYKKIRDNLIPIYEIQSDIRTYESKKADLAWIMTYLFPLSSVSGETEEKLHQNALRYTGEFGNFNVHASGIAAGNTETLELYLSKHKRIRHEFFSSTFASNSLFQKMYIVSLMEQSGIEILDLLLEMKPSSPFNNDYNYNYKLCFLISHFDDDRAIQKLLDEQKNGVWATDALNKASEFQYDRIKKLAPNFIKQNTLEISTNYVIPKEIIQPNQYIKPSQLQEIKIKQHFDLKPEFIWKDSDIEQLNNKNVNFHTSPQWNDVDINKLSKDEFEDYMLHCEKYDIPAAIYEGIYMSKESAKRRYDVGLELGYNYPYANLYKLIEHLQEVSIPTIAKHLTSASKEHSLRASSAIGAVELSPSIIMEFSSSKYKAYARKWILKYPKFASAGAISMYLEGNKKEKDASLRVLFFLKGNGHEKYILELAKKDGEKTYKNIKNIIEQDPLYATKNKLPKIPDYISFKDLPILKYKDGNTLSNENINEYLLKLAFSKYDEPHPDILLAKNIIENSDLVKFSKKLFDLWLENGGDSKEIWCMHSIGFWGDDSVIIEISNLVKEWPKMGFSKRAQSALDVFLNIGSDMALTYINILAEKSPFAGFKDAAKERIAMLADKLNLTSEELSDRLVPTFNLDNGGNILDFGSRFFTIKFDENLYPYIVNEENVKIKALPKPNKTDDSEKAKEAKKSFSNIKKLSKESALLQISRLEKMMQSQRIVDSTNFIKNFINHPWMKFITQNLLWCDKKTNTLFRIDGDGTLIDKNYDSINLLEDSEITLVHPINMNNDIIEEWKEIFSDNEITQPFKQLNREIFYINEEEKVSDDNNINRFNNIVFNPNSISKLEKNNWEKWLDTGVNGIVKSISKNIKIIIYFDPGWYIGASFEDIEEQKIYHVFIKSDKKLKDIEDFLFSEIIFETKKALF